MKVGHARRDIFEDAALEHQSFAEAVPEFQIRRHSPLLVVISGDGRRITHVADGYRGLRAGTGQRRLNARNIRRLRKAIPFAKIIATIPATVHGPIKVRLKYGGLLPKKSFEALLSTLMKLAPDQRDFLQPFSEHRRALLTRLSSATRKGLAAQKEALSSALAIAEIDRSMIRGWTPPTDSKLVSFIDGLPSARVLEDQMIWHDQFGQLPGFKALKRSITGIARFENDQAVLEVIVANRAKLERQTGADLIYFNATFSSFVLVQYKVMEPDGSSGTPIFRLPNAKLTSELSRMDRTLVTLRVGPRKIHRHGFRLHENPFFLKLCPRIIFDPDSITMTPGMYLPLGYWRSIEKDRDLVGARGGRVVSYENIGRYMNNSEFISMVRGAWIGTSPAQTVALIPVVRALLSQDRAALIAIKCNKPKSPSTSSNSKSPGSRSP